MTPRALRRREYWVSELARLSGTFGDDATRMIAELRAEIARDGVVALLDHLRSCGAMPERYSYDSSEEKLYSKYTDAVVSESLTALGIQSAVVTARGDVADVQARGGGFSLVADAKAFRLSRTAKNQKDFKIQAMDGWRNGLDFALVVCPIYQLPATTSQIYLQAIARNVCILSYSHLAALVELGARRGERAATSGLGRILRSVSLLHPSKSAGGYWLGINGALVGTLRRDGDLWTAEKTASLDAFHSARDEALAWLRLERDRILGLSHGEALAELVRALGIESRLAQVGRAVHGILLGS